MSTSESGLMRRRVNSLGGIDLGDLILLLIGLGLLIWSIGDRFGWFPGLTSVIGI